MNEIRPAAREDAGAIAALVNAAYRGHDGMHRGWTGVSHLLEGPRVDVALITQWIDQANGVLLVASQDQNVVGCVHLSILRPTVGEISLLAISPALQGHGLGATLLQAAESYLQSTMGCARAELTVLAPRPELEDWYRRRGYLETGHRRPLRDDGEGYGIPKRSTLELVEFARALV